MSSNTPRRPVVVGYNNPGTQDRAVDWALHEAARRDLPVRILVAAGGFRATAPGIGAATPWLGDLAEDLVEEARRYAEANADGLTLAVESSVESPAAMLVRASHEAQLVVVGRGHHGAASEFFVGSTSAQVVAHAKCPVVVVDQSWDRGNHGPIVVAVDGSPANESALAFAFERASTLRVPIVAVHAWWLDAPDRFGLTWLSEEQIATIKEAHGRLLEDSVAPWSDKYPDVEVHSLLVRGEPVESIVQESDDAQLIVVGSRGHGGFTGLLLGSVSQGLLHHERPCPLVVVHGESAPVLAGAQS